MSSKQTIALFVTRRQKRLAYWQKHLECSMENLNLSQKIDEMLEIYRFLLARFIKAPCADDRTSTELRILDIEREFESLFENRRYAINSIAATNKGFSHQ